ncbi:MAG: hypothetical protein QXK94_10580, partial [Candidatus Jordarchaeales archaeon]
VVSRISSVEPDDLIKAIESDDTDVVSKLSKEDREVLSLAAVRFHEYLSLLTVENVMKWLVKDAPFIAGIIYGHPKGLEWLRKVIDGVKSTATSELAKRVELIEVRKQ